MFFELRNGKRPLKPKRYLKIKVRSNSFELERLSPYKKKQVSMMYNSEFKTCFNEFNRCINYTNYYINNPNRCTNSYTFRFIKKICFG